ncbi:hypothetical protein GCM10009738_69890 [Kitasatospora viridis]
MPPVSRTVDRGGVPPSGGLMVIAGAGRGPTGRRSVRLWVYARRPVLGAPARLRHRRTQWKGSIRFLLPHPVCTTLTPNT